MRNSGISSECLDYNAPEHSMTGAQLSLFSCHGQGGNQVVQTAHGLRNRWNVCVFFPMWTLMLKLDHRIEEPMGEVTCLLSAWVDASAAACG